MRENVLKKYEVTIVRFKLICDRKTGVKTDLDN